MQFSSLFFYFLIANLLTKVAALYFYYDAVKPVANLTRIEVTYNNEYSHDEGIFWSNQFAFQGGQGGYMGFQPRPNGPDHLVFSFFGANATSDSPYCKEGADGYAGISCMHEFEWIKNRNYTIAVELEHTNSDGSNLWQGTLQDDVTGEKLTIANFTLPATYQKLSSSLITWLEWYLNKVADLSKRFPCSPKASYSFWTPRYFKNGEEHAVKQEDYKPEPIGDGCAYEHNTPNQNVTAIPGGYYVQNGIFD